MSDDQRKKSRQLAFANPMRLADEHAALLTAAQAMLSAESSVKKKFGADDLLGSHKHAVDQLRSAVEKAVR